VLGSGQKVRPRKIYRAEKKAPPRSRASGWMASPEEHQEGEDGFSAGPQVKGSTAANISCARPFASRSDKCYKFCAGLGHLATPQDPTPAKAVAPSTPLVPMGPFSLAISLDVPRWDTQ
jgi:hypothetical protein